MEEPARRHYYDGNTIRKVKEVPQHVRQPRKRKHLSKTVKRNRERALVFSKGYTFVLGIATVATLAMCVSYLSMQAKVTQQTKNIARQEKELSSLIDENNATQERLHNLVDLNRVYKIATKELGMVYADDKQIIYYDSKNPDYVRQYEDIPTK